MYRRFGIGYICNVAKPKSDKYTQNSSHIPAAVCIGGSRGAPPARPNPPPEQDPFLSFSHTFLPKSACVRGQHPPDGSAPPPTGNPGSTTGLDKYYHWQIQGAPRHVPPQQDQFLLFSHTFSLKSVRVRGWHPPPPNGSAPPPPPQREILDPPLIIVVD